MDTRVFSPRIALFLAGCAAFINLYSTQGLLDELSAAFAISARQASWSITVTTLAVAITALFVGRLTQRAEQHRVIALAAILLALPALLGAQSGSFGGFLLWRAIQGLLIPVVFVICIAYIGQRWDADSVTEVTSVYVAGTVLGGFCGRFLTGWFTELTDWRVALETLAGLSLILGLAIAWLLPRNPPCAINTVASRQSLHGKPFSKPLLAAYAVGFCVLFAQVAMFTYVGLHLGRAPYSLTTGAVGAIYSVFLLALVVVPIAGRLGKARPHRQLLAAAACLGITGSLLTLTSSLWLIIAGLALSSTGTFLAQTAANAFITANTLANKARAVGLYLASYYLGGSLGALVPGWLWDVGGWPACIALIILFQMLPLMVVLHGWKSSALPVLAGALAVTTLDSSSNKENVR